MIGIKAISSFIPAGFVDNIAQAEQFGESPDFIERKIGAFRLPRIDAGLETSDIAARAITRLLESTALGIRDIDALVLVTQNGDSDGLPHTSAIVQSKLGISNHVAAFDVSLGCSGYVYGLHILKGFLESTGLRNGILVTADPYSKIIDPGDRTTSLLFGDAATATWLGPAPSWEIGQAVFGTNGDGAGALKKMNGKLFMHGRDVFDFAARHVAPNIKELLAKAEIAEEDVDAFCIHQGSNAIVDAVTRRFKESKSKFITDIEITGNTVSSSIPLLLERHVLTTSLKHVVLCGFGVGFSWGSVLLKKSWSNEEQA